MSVNNVVALIKENALIINLMASVIQKYIICNLSENRFLICISFKVAHNQLDIKLAKRKDFRELSSLQLILLKHDFAFAIDHVPLSVNEIAPVIDQVAV